MCREILSTCVRNTEEAARAAKSGEGGRRGGKGVWGMIEESKLAQSIRLDEEKKVSFMSFACFVMLILLQRLKRILSFAPHSMSLS